MQNDHLPIIEVNNLTTSFYVGGTWESAITDINFKIPYAKTIALVGESGSGKSVTSLSITKLLPSQTSQISSGEVVFKGKVSLSNLSEKELRSYRTKKIGMIFQDPMSSLNPVERCGKQVMEPLRLHLGLSKKQAKRRVLELFNDVELPEPLLIYKKYPFELSGGQKQRVMIAIAMSCEPDLLIADEPTTALDPKVSKSIIHLIKSLQKKSGMSVLFITHDLDILSGFADEIFVMYQGKIVEKGFAEKILNSPTHIYTRALIACKPPKDHRPKRLPAISDFMANKNFSPEIESEEERVAIHRKIYSEEPILRCDNLSVHFPIKSGIMSQTKGVIKAVDKVSFELYPGETLGLVGPSGCGKTTLGRALLQLINPSEGQVQFQNENIVDYDQKSLRRLRQKMQIIFQDPYSSLNPRLRVGEAISEPLKAHRLMDKGKIREKVSGLLEKVGLSPSHYNRYPHEFSGGQRQRIGIARTLILNPKIIVCDEAVSALDVSVQAQILNLLNDLKEDLGLTYLFISHDMDVVRYFSDRVMVMENGKIVSAGLSEEILN